jgi:multiple sugar transport system substrate-binding protein
MTKTFKEEQMSKSFSRRDFLRLSTLTAGGAILAACGAPATPAAPSGSGETQPTAAPPSGEKITLHFWSHNNPAFVAINETLVKKFTDANPNVDVVYENFPYNDFIAKIQTSMAAKNEADVIEMFGSWVQSYAKGNTLSPLPESVMTYAKAQELYFAAPLDGYVWEGKLYGLPNEYNLENGGVLINKKIFKDAGVTDPPVWNTWDELVADGKKMTKMDGQNMTVAGFHYINGDGLGFLYWEGVLERGADYFAADKIHLDFMSPQAEATVQWLVDMSVKDKVVDSKTFNGTTNYVGDSFFQSLVAIGYIGPWIVPQARINHPDFADPWDYVSCPHYGDKMSFAADSGWGKVVSPNSKAVQKAWDFTQYWTADSANARAWNVGTGTIPALKAVAADATLIKDMNWIGPSLKVLPFGRYVGNLQDRDFVWYQVVANHITECMQGVRSVKDTMKLMNDEANAQIDSKLKS